MISCTMGVPLSARPPGRNGSREAPCCSRRGARTGMRAGHRLSQQVSVAEGSLIRVVPGRAGAALTKPGRGHYCQMVRVRRAWRKGVREEPALLRPSTLTPARASWLTRLWRNLFARPGRRSWRARRFCLQMGRHRDMTCSGRVRNSSGLSGSPMSSVRDQAALDDECSRLRWPSIDHLGLSRIAGLGARPGI
jgi:hypothetical protein